MRVDLLSAVSINGLVTMGRGRSSYDVIEYLPPIPPEFWAVKAEIRRRHDAVLIGTNTVVTNDPTMASHGSPEHQVVRATLDRTGRIPRHFRFFDGSVRTLIGVTGTTPPDYLRFLEERGVEAVLCGAPEEESKADLRLFLGGLEAKGIRSVVCEGGGILSRALLDQGLLGNIHILLLPVILDGGSVNLFEGPGMPVSLKLEGVERVWDAVVLRYSIR
ncbi:MAG: 2,5-diamino-6-(ribosylamino)-4(3H)-pyrimidinone 5-phosphate reductase [Acidobacteriota bacterium]|jgi:riboflavin biosynthesis pyrimidine reductase|nr:2,5-diamino-6-(ribosylamino)-4(3H)-pyrimidinone 5-phosphate reductase [Acidobacteriota bacterium]